MTPQLRERIYDRTNPDYKPEVPSEVTCVLVHYADGCELFTPLRDYLRNPERGSYIVSDRRKRQA